MRKKGFGFIAGLVALSTVAAPGVQTIPCNGFCIPEGHSKRVKSFDPNCVDRRLVLKQVCGCSDICYGRTYRASSNTGRTQR